MLRRLLRRPGVVWSDQVEDILQCVSEVNIAGGWGLYSLARVFALIGFGCATIRR